MRGYSFGCRWGRSLKIQERDETKDDEIEEKIQKYLEGSEEEEEEYVEEKMNEVEEHNVPAQQPRNTNNMDINSLVQNLFGNPQTQEELERIKRERAKKRSRTH